jgi:hypothetical protein
MRKPRETSASRTPAFWLAFRNTYVFDVEETEGVDLPSMREVYGEVGETLILASDESSFIAGTELFIDG